MRDHKELWGWECEHYKGRKPNPYRIWYVIVVIVWAVFIASLLLLTTEKPEPEPAAEDVNEMVFTPAAEESIEEPEEVVNLTGMKQIENATLTHYCCCEICTGKTPDHPAYGITASGRPAEPYVSVAVDPLMIPLGSTVYLDYGDGTLHQFRADDTGSGVAGAHIDLCVEDHQTALELGRETVKVYWEEDV